MSQKFRGIKKRLFRKREDRVQTIINKRKIEKRDLKKSIHVRSLVNVDTPTDWLLVELSFFHNQYSANAIAKLLEERIGDIF